MRLRHKFVDHIPDQLDEGVLYVSMQFGTMVHQCACGCGQEVVTPLGPAEWQLTYDGKSISVAPSIGNWSFQCRSHYWIKNSNVRWARGFSDDEVALVRQKAKTRREGFYQPRGSVFAGKDKQKGKVDSRRRPAWQTVKKGFRSLIRIGRSKK